MPHLLDGSDRASLGDPTAQCRPQAERGSAAVDHRHLRIPCCRVADHHGHTRRPDRASAVAPDRGRRVWRGFGPRRVLDQRQHADCDARPARLHRGYGRAIGPLIGGVLLEYFWWGSVFLIAVPVMVLLLIVGPRLLPEYRDPQAGRPDILSAAMSLSAVLSIIYGLKEMAQDGIGWLAV